MYLRGSFLATGGRTSFLLLLPFHSHAGSRPSLGILLSHQCVSMDYSLYAGFLCGKEINKQNIYIIHILYLLSPTLSPLDFIIPVVGSGYHVHSPLDLGCDSKVTVNKS